jgi:hypothetical protein
VDPISIGLLTALAGGAGGEAGRRAWSALSALVRRPLRQVPVQSERALPGDATAMASQGVGALAALERSPGDVDRARALSAALTARAVADPNFARALDVWAGQARTIQVTDDSTHNTISGTVYGGVVQGRDAGSIIFGPSDSGS